MPVQRSGPTPPYYEYICSKAIVPSSSPPGVGLLSIATGDFSWVEIPRFQRGITWDIEQVEEFLSSASALLGNVILGNFSLNGKFPLIPSNFKTYCTLVDGLQRLAVGTIILSILDPLVLSPTPSRPGEAFYFQALKARVQPLSPVYLHNDDEFKNHPRKAIADQYVRLRDRMEDYILEQINEGQVQSLSTKITHTMFQKQVAIDIYFNFNGPLELMNTFLGLNTVRVDLGPVDLLRATLVERASSSGWMAQEIEEMENDFTATFTNGERPKPELLPFVSIVLKAINGGQALRIFPSWSGNLIKGEVDAFLGFIDDLEMYRDNGYYNEIRASGSLPFATLIAYYYMKYVHHGHQKPSFLTSGTAEQAEMHEFLLATYRILLDGKISRTRFIAERFISGTLQDLGVAAEQVSTQFIGASTKLQVDPAWLFANLSKADNNRARRVFNAMLLPKRQVGFGKMPFDPLQFGRAAVEFHIDHILPESLIFRNKPGHHESNSLRNYAPLPSNLNQVAEATSASEKLKLNGLYSNYINGTTHKVHPYCVWLIDPHASSKLPPDLDKQALLEPNKTPPIGDERLRFICDELLQRL